MTILSQLGLVQRSFVARRARGCDVFATQTIFSIGIVVERGWFPGFDTVARLTLFAILTFVALGAVVIFFVAAHAGAGGVFVLVCFVAI